MAEREEAAEGFLGRWSRLKREARTGEETPAEPLSAEPLPAERSEEVEPAGLPAEDDVPAPPDPLPPDLPPLDSLDAGSDYTGFLRREVPEELRRQALRKAWATDPAIAGFRGFAEYDWDFNAPGYGALRPTDDIARLLEAVLPSGKREEEAVVAGAETGEPIASPSSQPFPADGGTGREAQGGDSPLSPDRTDLRSAEEEES